MPIYINRFCANVLINLCFLANYFSMKKVYILLEFKYFLANIVCLDNVHYILPAVHLTSLLR